MFVSAPLLVGLLGGALFLSLKHTKSALSLGDYLAAISRKINPTALALAFAATLVVAALSFQGDLTRYAGFPATFVTYHGLPQYQFRSGDAWPWSGQLSVNMLSFWVDVGLWYLALSLADRLLRRF